MTYRAFRGCLVVLLLLLGVSSRARADESRYVPPSALPAAPPAPPNTAQQPPIVVGAHTCFVGEHAGIDAADARTTTDLVCGELGPRKASPGIYDVHLGRLGPRVLLGISERATGLSRRLLIQTLDEVPVAAGRLVAALVEQRPLEATQDVDNVVSSESRVPKSKALDTVFELGLVGMTGLGFAPNASAGAAAGVMFRSHRFAMGGHVRGGGVGSGSNKLGFASFDVGARYYLGDADTALFVGGGVALSYTIVNRDLVTAPATHACDYCYYSRGTDADLSPSGSGFGAYVEGGVELLRSSRAGAVLSLRADAPFYLLKNNTSLGEGTSAMRVDIARYVVPVSVNLGFRFH